MDRRGKRWKLWMVVALASLLVPVGVASFARRSMVLRPQVGVEWVQSLSGPLAIAVEEGSAAWRAGLKAGDLLISVNGRPMRSALDAAQIGWSSGQGEALALVLERGQGSLQVSLVPDLQPQAEIYIYLSVVGLAFLVSGLFIALCWPNIRGGFLYSILALSLFAHFVFSHTGIGDAFDWAIYWLDLVAGALAPALLLHLAMVLSRTVFRRSVLLIASGYGTFVILTLSAIWLSPSGRGGAYLFREPLRAIEARDRIEPLVLAIALLVAVALLVKSFNQSSSVLHRSQMRWVLWGLGLGLGPSVLFYFVPFAVGAPELPNWAVFVAAAPTLFVPAAFTAALARYRLHDLDDWLVRGFTEVSAVFCAFAVYASAAFVLREIVSEIFPFSRSATRYVSFVVAAVLYAQCRAWSRTGVEKAFYRKRYSYRATLLDWARELNAETDLNSLIERLRDRISATLGVPDAEVLLQIAAARFEALPSQDARAVLDLDERSAERLENEPYIAVPPDAFESLPWVRYLFAARVKGRTRALIAVSERPELEEPLSTEDRALLATLAAYAASAIEAARLVLEVRLRAEEIERLHARQENILENSAVGLLLVDEEGRIQTWNRALEGIYGLARADAVGRMPADVFPLHVVRRIEREAREVDEGRESRVFRLSLVNRVDERVVVNMSISPVEASRGGGRVVALDDVTQRVKLEEQVLQQERLASLGLLAAGVAHEINTPLTGISSYAQMLIEDSSDGDDRRGLLEKIEAQASRASKITSSLLNLARPEETTFEDLDVSVAAQEVLQLFEPQLRGRGIRLERQLAENLPKIRGHKGKLQQVLLNLLINARDAVNGEGRITLTTGHRDGHVVIEIEDNGSGIPEDDLPRIFDPFFTTKGRAKGTGLGLSISYGIVREHDGEIVVESRRDVYTRFRIELPVADSARAAG